MGIVEAIEAIKKEFLEKFDVDIDLKIWIHNLSGDTKNPSRKHAERIIKELSEKIGGEIDEDKSTALINQGEKIFESAWLKIENDDVSITVFYPPEEYTPPQSYHEEGENASVCSPGTEEATDHAEMRLPGPGAGEGDPRI